MHASTVISPAAMKLADPAVTLVCDEKEVFEALLPLQGARILELGCGKAEKTRTLAQGGKVASITALEVDCIQHAKNLQVTDLPNVSFREGGAEAIPAADGEFDIVLMFKSLHHVPMDSMDTAFREIHRVLKPGGVAYISEPVFAGAFNEILRLFNDEQRVREAAFAAVQRAVAGGLFQLGGEKFFSTPSHFEGFEQFEQQILQVTHSNHQLSPELHREVKERFMAHVTPQGADFQMPLRVDLLRRIP